MDRIAPRKSLGQNFLTDKNIAGKIVRLLDISREDIVLEIGPGEGALTGILAETGARVIAFDIDIRAIDYLNRKYNYDNLRIVNLDFREVDLSEFLGETSARIKVIGNIPYNISSDIIFKLFENAGYISRALLTVQREVARRVNAAPGNKEYGILSVARAMTAESRIEFNIPPGCFYPPPKVTSSVIRLDFYDDQKYADIYQEIMRLVRAAFNQRRKVLSNSLKKYIEKYSEYDKAKLTEIAKKSGLNYFSRRAEQLDCEDFIKLHKLIHSEK